MPATADPTGALVSEVLADCPVLDGHNDLPWELRELGARPGSLPDLDAPIATTQTDLPRMRLGGVRAQFWSVFVPQRILAQDAVRTTLEQVELVSAMVAAHPDRMVAARTADDVRAAWKTGRIAALMGAEGGHSIDSSLDTLRHLHGLGVGYLTLTHNENVSWADSATDSPVLGGLSEFGREVVREMNRLGMLVDLSHVSAATMRDALAVTEAPAIFSHSSAYAVCPHPRNVPDDVLETLAGQGGVCMVTFVPKFVNEAVRLWDVRCHDEAVAAGVDPKDDPAYTAYQLDYRRRAPQPTSTVADVVAHIDHVREVAGRDHVGLGGDYDGVTRQPDGLEDVTGYPRLLAALADRGWSRSDLASLTSGNILRVMAGAEEVARDLSSRPAPPPKAPRHASS